MLQRLLRRARGRHISTARGLTKSAKLSKMQRDIIRLKRKTAGKEVQAYDGVQTSASVVSTGNTPVLLTAIAGGTAENQRTGNDVQLLGVKFRGQLEYGATQTEHCRVRVMVVKGRSNTTPAYQGVLVAAGIDYFRTVDYRKSSHIMFDKTYTLHDNKKIVKLNINLKKRFKVEWSSTTATDVAMNNVYLMVISDSSGSTHDPVIAGRWRINYYDN